MKNIFFFFHFLQSFYEEQAIRIVIIYSFIIGVWSAWYFYSHKLLTILVDQNAHLNIARQVLDSLTPGASQFGSWPPFSEIIMMPFVWNDFLWQSGLAGTIPVVICFIITTVFLYKSVLFLSKSHIASIVAVLLFSLNPNILELAVSPLMEMPFFMFSILAFYYVSRWLKQERVSYLFACATISTMAALTRFDGFIFPFALAGIILLKYIFLRKSIRRLEATLIIFLFLGVVGIALDLIYNAIFLGDPLAFARGTWSAYAQQHISGSFLPSQHNIKNTFLYYGQAVIDNIGISLTIVSIISFFLVTTIKRNISVLSLLFLVATPAFYLLSLYQGSTIIYVKELPPFLITNNRYGTSIALFSAILPALALGMFLKWKALNKLVPKLIVSLLALTIVIFYGTVMLKAQSIDQNNYNFLYYGERDKDFFVAVDALKNKYDGGKIFITRSVSDVFVNSVGIGISNLIQESNYIFWQKTLDKPWLYARYVVMFNPKIGGWAEARDEISKKWFGKSELYSFYDVIMENKRYTIFKINDERVREYARENDLNITEMPSINTSLTRWNPNTQEEKIGWKKGMIATDLLPESTLLLTWKSYKAHYISSQGQVVTNDTERPTTSEGQSYALLRSVIMDDQDTFKKVLSWTEHNLLVDNQSIGTSSAELTRKKQSKKYLFAWLWGKRSNGTYGIKDAGNATDADEDIALALLFAYKKWGNNAYLEKAMNIIGDIWTYETVAVSGKRYLVAGDWAGKKDNIIYTTNPSYLAPYAYRIFAEVDPKHQWNSVVDSSYDLLTKCSSELVKGKTGVGIPPEWCGIDRAGRIIPAKDMGANSISYSYNATRTLWRIALDYQWYGDKRSLDYLSRMLFWQNEWNKNHKIYATYSYEGHALESTESLTNYGNQLAFFEIINPKIADQIYKIKILTQYKSKDNMLFWGDPDNYYDQNWVWFGYAFYTHNIPNLWNISH